MQSNSDEAAKKYRDAVHIMGGIRVGSVLTFAFDECLRQKCRLGIMSEPYNHAKLSGLFRSLKYVFYRVRYARRINFILAIGKKGVQQYRKLGYDERYIFPWAYFVDVDSGTKNVSASPEIQRIVYAGRLEPGKGIYRFVQELINSANSNYTLDLYGEGPDEVPLKKLVMENKLSDEIRFFGFQKHEELLKKYAIYDWVVLPSTQKDGWGVIVSEGLLYANGFEAI